MRTDAFGRELCEAGGDADFGGRWTKLCKEAARNILGSTNLDVPLRFCDEHMQQLIDAGLVMDPNLHPMEWSARATHPNWDNATPAELALMAHVNRKRSRSGPTRDELIDEFSENLIQQLADEAEVGYDRDQLHVCPPADS